MTSKKGKKNPPEIIMHDNDFQRVIKTVRSLISTVLHVYKNFTTPDEASPLPCPYCGCKTIQCRVGWKWYAYYCDSCLSQTDSAPTEVEALAKWNKRTNEVLSPLITGLVSFINEIGNIEALRPLLDTDAALIKVPVDAGAVAADPGAITGEHGDVSGQKAHVAGEQGDVSGNRGDIALDPGDNSADPGDVAADPGDVAADSGDVSADQRYVAPNTGSAPADPGDVTADPGDVTTKTAHIT